MLATPFRLPLPVPLIVASDPASTPAATEAEDTALLDAFGGKAGEAVDSAVAFAVATDGEDGDGPVPGSGCQAVGSPSAPPELVAPAPKTMTSSVSSTSMAVSAIPKPSKRDSASSRLARVHLQTGHAASQMEPPRTATIVAKQVS